MGKYGTARSILTGIEICGWLFICLVVIGTVKAVRDGQNIDFYLVAAAVFGVALGLAMIASVQIARAVIDTAESTAEMVKLMRGNTSPSIRGAPPLSRSSVG